MSNVKGIKMEKAIYNSPAFGIDEKKIALVSKICAFMLALCPVLQHYKAPLFNAAISVLVLIVPFLCILVAANAKKLDIKMLYPVALMIVYQIFRVVNHGTGITELGQAGVIVIYMIAVSFGCVDLKNFVKFSSYVAFAGAAGLMLQYVCYYIFGFHLVMVPTSLLLDSAEQWVLGAKTGLAGITGVIRDTYRPSAFFLEPSHVFLYLFPHIILFLFNGKDVKESLVPAAFLSVGMVLSTSGMGIIAMCGSWVLYFVLKGRDGQFSVRNIFRKEVVAIFVAFAVIFLLAYIFIPVVHNTVIRIFVPDEEGGSTAIEGRVKMALRLLDGMSLKEYITGVRDNTHGIEFNIPGFADVIYRHGVFGMILSYSVYVWAVFRTSLPTAVVSLVVLVTSLFSAHTHATVGMINFIMILMSGRKRM